MGAFDELECRIWDLEFLKREIGEVKVQCRGKTDLDSYRKGTKYCIHETSVGEYIDDLTQGNSRAKSKGLLNLSHDIKILINL